MTPDELAGIRKAREPRTVSVKNVGQRPRTLLLGYTCDRLTWHVYLKNSVIHLLVFNPKEFARETREEWSVSNLVLSHDAREVWSASSLIPDKRVFPERTDFSFAWLLEKTGERLPFAGFNGRAMHETEGRDFKAPVQEELILPKD